MSPTQNAQSQSAMTPARALEILAEGNLRFRENRPMARNLTQQVSDTSAGQWPFAVVLNCIDSRTSAELLFDVGIGDIFSARIAGNFINEDILGSMEFGCEVAGARLIVVMGHTHCGAIKGACDDVQLGHLTGLLAKLKPALAQVSEPSDPAQRSSGNSGFVQSVARKNVALTVAAIREQSSILNGLEAAGSIQIVGSMYDVETGAVDFL